MRRIYRGTKVSFIFENGRVVDLTFLEAKELRAELDDVFLEDRAYKVADERGQVPHETPALVQ